MRAVYGSLLGLVISGTSGCLLFTDTINVPPTISIAGPAEVRRGRENMFTVSVANEGQGQTTLEWRMGATCPTSMEQAVTGAVIGRAETAMVQVQGMDRAACVWVVATDRRGARALDTHQVTVNDPLLELKGPATLVSGQQAEFTASYPSEPELEAHFYWGSADTCAAAREVITQIDGGARPTSRGFERHTQRVPRQAFCLVVRARDSYGVVAVAELSLPKPLNGDPFIRQIQMGPTPAQATPASTAVPLFSDVQLAAGAEGDFLPNEPVTFTWKVTGPTGAEVPVTPCLDALPAGSKVCFQPAIAGAYRVELIVVDAGVDRAAPALEVKVEDFPPCITTTSPPFLPGKLVNFEQQPRPFSVMEVQDDGDPLPAPARPSERGFYWYVREPGGQAFELLLRERSPSFIIPPRRYQALDRVQVRLEYRDRLREANRQARDLSHCKEDDPVCSLKHPTKGDCPQWVTWTVDYQ